MDRNLRKSRPSLINRKSEQQAIVSSRRFTASRPSLNLRPSAVKSSKPVGVIAAAASVTGISDEAKKFNLKKSSSISSKVTEESAAAAAMIVSSDSILNQHQHHHHTRSRIAKDTIEVKNQLNNFLKDFTRFQQMLKNHKTCIDLVYTDAFRELAALETPCMSSFNEETRKKLVENSKMVLGLFRQVQIPGDGNCLWNALSVALTGSKKSMMHVRLLTYFTLLDQGDYFTMVCRKSETHSFDRYLGEAIQLGEWGRDIHIHAMSNALHREIHVYNFSHNLNEFSGRYIYKPKQENKRGAGAARGGGGGKEPLNLSFKRNHFEALIPIEYPLRETTEILDASMILFDE